ncbi:MAG: hypothetical protein IKF99_01175 [Oscillospiraceae bacterium]|nr:hypothetical protein [Oscillospiraceae bacterium]
MTITLEYKSMGKAAQDELLKAISSLRVVESTDKDLQIFLQVYGREEAEA